MSIPGLAEIVEPLRILLEEHMGGIQRRTKRVASNRAITEEAWKRDQGAAWSNAQNLVFNAVALSDPKGGYEVLMFPNASNNHWRSFLTQVPTAELDDGVEVEKMSHEPLGCLSGTFGGSQQRRATVDKRGFRHRDHGFVASRKFDDSARAVVVVVFFASTDRASTIPSNTRGCQSGTWSAGQKNIRGTSIYQAPMRAKEKHKQTKTTKRKEQEQQNTHARKR